MRKLEMIDYINTHYDWFECMQIGLGHHSWWYTKRTPDECINVKVHAWVDSDKVLASLTDKERQAIKTLGIDLDKYLEELIWDDFGMVEQARQDLLDELKDKHNVAELEYGGSSGGWLAVIYSWDSVPDDYDNEAYTYREVKQFYNTIKQALAEHEQVTGLVLERKHELEQAIKDINSYVEQVKEMIIDKLEYEQAQAKQVLKLSI